MVNKFSAFLLISILSFGYMHAQASWPQVHIVGEMRNVMWKGQLGGTISIDTISNHKHLYGIGPIEYLSGEIMIMDGITYISTVNEDSSIHVESVSKVKAPFLAYASIPHWKAHSLPDSIQTISQLENYLDYISINASRPFLFKLSGVVDTALIHVMNLPKGATVSNPQEAHQSQVNYTLIDMEAEMLGFFSTEHQTIFTHHDTYVHLHLMSRDHKYMGHLDKVVFKKGSMTLFLPEDL